MSNIQVDLSNIYKFVPKADIMALQDEMNLYYPGLLNKTGIGNNFRFPLMLFGIEDIKILNPFHP